MTTPQLPADSLEHVLATERNKSQQPPVKKLSQKIPIYFLVWSLVIFQIMAFLILLSLNAPQTQVADKQDSGTSLDAPPSLPVPRPLTDEPLHFPKSPLINVSNLTHSLPITTHKIKIRGVEITQGTQVFHEQELARCQPSPDAPDYIFCNNSVPLVAGRYTLIRIYLGCDGTCPTTDTTVQLTVQKADLTRQTLTRQVSVDMLKISNALPLDMLRLKLEYSTNFEFLPPPTWFVGSITFEVAAAVDGTATTSTLTKDFVERRALRIAYLPIEYKGVKPADLPNADYWLKRTYPIAKVEYYPLPVPNLVWEGELNKNEILRKLLFTYWLFALHHPVSQWPDQLFGWLPQQFYNGGVSDPFWCPRCSGPHSSRVAFGGVRPEFDIGGPRILAHELAHNFGAQHAWSPTQKEDPYCFKAEGVDIQVDPAWPYVQSATTQEVGLDLYSTPPIVYPSSSYDMMAYCAKPWISPYSYRELFNSPFLKPGATVALPLPDFKPTVEPTSNGALLVSGVVYPDGNVSNPEIIQLEGEDMSNLAAGFSPSASGDYCVQVRDAQDKEIGKKCFGIGFADAETGETTPEASPFFVTLPQINLKNAAKVILSKQNKVLTTLKASNTPPQVTVTYPNKGESLDGQQVITWQASDADGDSLVYDVLYSLDNGQSWSPLAVRLKQTNFAFHTRQLSPSTHALIRVIANDGFYSSADDSNMPFSLNTVFDNSFSLQGPMKVKPAQTFEVAVTAHQITAPGLAEVQFKLNFDPNMLQMQTITVSNDLSQMLDQTTQKDGQISIQAKRANHASNLTGDLILAKVTFIAKQSGKTELSLSEVIAKTEAGQTMPTTEIWGLSLQVE